MKLSWGTSITIVYTAFALATLGFVAFAMTQRVDIVRPDYYEEALLHDSMQVARKRAVDQGSVVRLHNDTLLLLDSSASRLDAPVTIEWLRAQNPAMDVRSSTTISALTQNGVSTRNLERGRWTLRLSWNVLDRSFQIDTTLSL